MQTRHINPTNQPKAKSIIQLYIDIHGHTRPLQRNLRMETPKRSHCSNRTQNREPNIASRMDSPGCSRPKYAIHISYKRTTIAQNKATKYNIPLNINHNPEMYRDSVKSQPKASYRYRAYKHIATNLHIPRAGGGSRSW